MADYFFHVNRNRDMAGDAFLSILHDHVHIFSATGQNSTRANYYDKIVMSGWESRIARNENFTCCLIYNDSLKDIFLTRLSEKRDWSYLGMAKLEVKQYVCPNPFQKKGNAPIAVTLSVGKECPKDFNQYIMVGLPVEHPGEKLAVCAKLVYGNMSASAMIEWFEYQIRMGVSKVVAYTYKLNPDAMKVLEYYRVIGLAEFYPFSLPMRGKYTFGII